MLAWLGTCQVAITGSVMADNSVARGLMKDILCKPVLSYWH